ncbi:hypothetical protein, unlikely [Trypanosoma brucei gambiense DAL972]|uniref:Uncharacterized protein n=1 Tax=Trypanosoma brucei gambiense (strain MHOM/CI/86/DAL972) TaxID=679716 RepID=D0A1T8_TRYB9|nr:hypothetical protein, unlikely [Trypanosoma brucei gambiense DAL972]CBH15231.1 hypothetical protein, unlikely [Trypanosoma brucei gambiense DAL972]|eukprot:XP_011777496.1 hypothetical protein, unlikely [Trypanosoma brucei gambiense DAL972]
MTNTHIHVCTHLTYDVSALSVRSILLFSYFSLSFCRCCGSYAVLCSHSTSSHFVTFFPPPARLSLGSVDEVPASTCCLISFLFNFSFEISAFVWPTDVTEK